jgi:transcriptional regulator with XRE-family HTH domain
VRKAAGLTQAELAKRLGIANPTLSKYERGHRVPDAGLLCRLAHVLGCDPGWLLTGHGRQQRPASLEVYGKLLEAPGQEPVYLTSRGLMPLKKLAALKGLTPQEFEHHWVQEAPGVFDTFVRVSIYPLAAAGQRKALCGPQPSGSVVLPLEMARPEVKVVRVLGKAMEPTILEGAVVGVDTRDKSLQSGRLYALWLEAEGAVLRRLFVEAKKVCLKADNPLFPPLHIDKEYLKEILLGRVAWVLQWV